MDLCLNFQVSTIQEFNIFHINLSIHRAQLFLATNYHVCVCIEIWYRLRNEVQMQGEKTSESVSRAERESTTASEVSLRQKKFAELGRRGGGGARAQQNLTFSLEFFRKIWFPLIFQISWNSQFFSIFIIFSRFLLWNSRSLIKTTDFLNCLSIFSQSVSHFPLKF